MNCERCGCEVHGDILVREGELPDGTWVVALLSTPDRDWIACDRCNRLLCHGCCRYPQSGYCDACIEGYNLYTRLVEAGLIQEHHAFKNADAGPEHLADGDLERRMIDEAIEQEARHAQSSHDTQHDGLTIQEGEKRNEQGTIPETQRKG